MTWVPKKGMKVRLSDEGYAQGLVSSRELAQAAEEMTIIKVYKLGPDAYQIEVTGPMNQFLLTTSTLERK